jgi:site-specific recombinase XerD
MSLSEIVSQYITYKQSMGMRFRTEDRTLKSFCKAMGDVGITEVQPDRVQSFLAGTGPITRFWHRKHEALRGFYRFAMARSYVAVSPLPSKAPQPPHAFVPYIFSHEELRRLLDAAASSVSHWRCHIRPHTCRMLILLLYGAGLRISEALSLTLGDVNLTGGILTIRESKFYKTRLVPIGPDLIRALTGYATQRAIDHPAKPDAPLLVSRTGTPVTRQTAENTFVRLRVRAGVLRHDGARYQPRLHDLRHAFAVHRVVSWYRQGADVQRLLPKLATYLGHVHIAATQRYLTLTPELLKEASRRFEHYAGEGRHE